MAVPFPQIDRPIGITGGSDLWDLEPAPNVIYDGYFEAESAPTFTGSGGVTVSNPAATGSGVYQFFHTGSGGVTVSSPAVSGAGAFSITYVGSGGVTVSSPTVSGTGNYSGTFVLGGSGREATVDTSTNDVVLIQATHGGTVTSSTREGSVVEYINGVVQIEIIHDGTVLVQR